MKVSHLNGTGHRALVASATVHVKENMVTSYIVEMSGYNQTNCS